MATNASKVDDKVEDLKANTEASVELAAAPYDAVGEPGDGKRVFLDASGGDDAKKINPKAGKVTDKDVWEEVFMQNTTQPSYVLRWHAGQTLPDDLEYDDASFRFNDYGAY